MINFRSSVRKRVVTNELYALAEGAALSTWPHTVTSEVVAGGTAPTDYSDTRTTAIFPFERSNINLIYLLYSRLSVLYS